MSDDEAQKCKKLGPMDLNEFDQLSSTERGDKWKEIQSYIEALESMVSSPKTVCARAESPKEDLGSFRNSSVLSMKLARKEREVQELLSNMHEMRQYSAPSGEQLRRMLLDPAVNLMFKEMSKTLGGMENKLKEAQEDTAAWTFTTDSLTGKRLMAKCRQLHQENEQLGLQISSGRIAKLEGDLALQKQANEDLKKNHSELEDCVEECEEESEALESMCHFFKENLKEKEDALNELREEFEKLGRTCEQCGHVSEVVTERKLIPVNYNVGSDAAIYDIKTEPALSPLAQDRTTGGSTVKLEGANMDVNNLQQHIPSTQQQTSSVETRKRRHIHHAKESMVVSTLHSADSGSSVDKRTRLDRGDLGLNSDDAGKRDSNSSYRTSLLEGNPRKDRTVKHENLTIEASSELLLNSESPTTNALTESHANGDRTLSPSPTHMEQTGDAEDASTAALITNNEKMPILGETTHLDHLAVNALPNGNLDN